LWPKFGSSEHVGRDRVRMKAETEIEP